FYAFEGPGHEHTLHSSRHVRPISENETRLRHREREFDRPASDLRFDPHGARLIDPAIDVRIPTAKRSTGIDAGVGANGTRCRASGSTLDAGVRRAGPLEIHRGDDRLAG